MEYRVLHIIYSLNMGGAENFIMNIYRNIDRKRMQFDFLVHRHDFYDQEVEEMGGRIFYLDGYVNELGVKKYRELLLDFFKVGNGKEYKIIHLHVNQTSGLIIPIIKQTTGAVCLAHSHDLQNYNSFPVRIYKRYLQFLLNYYTDYRLACSYAAGSWLFGNKDFSIINNGIDFRRFQFSKEIRNEIRTKLKIDNQTIVLGHVGRFTTIKNQKFLIELMECSKNTEKNIKLLLIGDGDLKQDIIELVKNKGLREYVYFISATADVNLYYNVMDIFLLPSHKEALGMVGIEAQVNGLPVIASTGVAREMKIGNNVCFIDLDHKIWNKEMNTVIGKISAGTIIRENVEVNEMFDINNSSKKLVDLYEKGVNRYENTHK